MTHPHARLVREIHESIAPADVKDAFCKAWPDAKPALEALRNILAVVPNIGIFAGPAISVVLAAGDAAAHALCQGQ
jgi:hypothetical protein